MGMAILLAAIGLAVAFDITNGFHDSANSVAALVDTRAATPAQALTVATAGSFAGAGCCVALNHCWPRPRTTVVSPRVALASTLLRVASDDVSAGAGKRMGSSSQRDRVWSCGCSSRSAAVGLCCPWP